MHVLLYSGCVLNIMYVLKWAGCVKYRVCNHVGWVGVKYHVCNSVFWLCAKYHICKLQAGWVLNIIIISNSLFRLWVKNHICKPLGWMCVNKYVIIIIGWLGVKGPRKAVFGYKIAPNRFKTTYRSVLTFEYKKQSITHLFKTFTGLRLDCNAFILAKRSEKTVNCTFWNQRHFECEIPRELF